jgi:hemolysin III
LLEGATRRWFLRVVWAFALAGVGCMWLLPKAPHSAIVGIYLGVGWAGILPLPLYYRAIGWRAMNYVWAGALCYTACALCELTDWPTIVPGWIGSHEMLHFFVTAGNLVYFLFVLRYVIPYEKPSANTQITQPLSET